MGRILLLESSDIGARYTAEAVRQLGHEPLFACRIADYQADPRAQLEACPRVECDTTQSSEVRSALRAQGISDVAAVMTFSDTRLKTALQLSHELALQGLDPAISQLKDKGIVARLAPEFSPPSLAFDAEAVPEDWIRQCLADAGAVIIKPTGGAGALGVFCVSHADNIPLIAQVIHDKQIPSYLGGKSWIAQAFLRGELTSLEGYALQGQIRFLGFTSRRRIESTETAAAFPADQALSTSQRERARAATQTLIERSGFKNGYFHLEFMFGAESCDLIDANVGRLGGGPLGELLALSHGLDPIEVYRHVLEVSLFNRQSRDPYLDIPALLPSYSVLYGLKDGGELVGVDFPSDSRCYHTRILGPGAQVSPVGKDDWSWIGIVSGLASDTQAAVDRLRIRTKTGTFEPSY